MAKTFDELFIEEVKRVLKAKVSNKDINNIPLPREAGGSLDIKTNEAIGKLQYLLDNLHNNIGGKGFFRPRQIQPFELTQKAYDSLANFVNAQGITPQLAEYIEDNLEQDQIGSELLFEIKHLCDELGKALNTKTDSWYVSEKELFKIIGIPDDIPYFSELNDELVFKPKSNDLVRRKQYSILEGDYIRDDDGEYISESVNKPEGSIYICTTKNLKIPFGEKMPRGYDYVTMYNDKKENKVFIYVVPKKVVYPIKQLALVLTKRTNMKAFEMVAYHTWQCGQIALAVIPYDAKYSYVNHSTKVLATAYGYTVDGVYDANFRDKVDLILQTWISSNIMGDPSDFQIEGEWGDSFNLIVDESKKTLDKSEYLGISNKNLLEVNEDELRSNNAFEENELDNPEAVASNSDDDEYDWSEFFD